MWRRRCSRFSVARSGDTPPVTNREIAAENVELLRRLHDGFLEIGPDLRKRVLDEAATFDEAAAMFAASEAAPEYAELLGRVAADVVIDSRDGTNPFGHGGLWRGRDEWWEFWREWLETWDDFDYDASNFEAIGDDVLIDLRIRGRGRGSGVPVEWSQTQIWTFRDGEVTRLRPGYESREAAVAAAGRVER